MVGGPVRRIQGETRQADADRFRRFPPLRRACGATNAPRSARSTTSRTTVAGSSGAWMRPTAPPFDQAGDVLDAPRAIRRPPTRRRGRGRRRSSARKTRRSSRRAISKASARELLPDPEGPRDEHAASPTIDRDRRMQARPRDVAGRAHAPIAGKTTTKRAPAPWRAVASPSPSSAFAVPPHRRGRLPAQIRPPWAVDDLAGDRQVQGRNSVRIPDPVDRCRSARRCARARAAECPVRRRRRSRTTSSSSVAPSGSLHAAFAHSAMRTSPPGSENEHALSIEVGDHLRQAGIVADHDKVVARAALPRGGVDRQRQLGAVGARRIGHHRDHRAQQLDQIDRRRRRRAPVRRRGARRRRCR